MPFPTEGFPLAAAISPRVQAIETTDSTNADLVRHVREAPDQWPHLSLLLTNDQRAGRGRLDRSWTAPAGTALAVSVMVDASAVPPASRGWIPLIAGAAMTRAIAAQTQGTGHSARLKWPNDVLMDGGKICGILAEVVPEHPDSIVVGAGVNTRMSATDLPVDTASSFLTLGLEADEDRLLSDYLTALDEQLQALAASGGDAAASGVLGEVESLCVTLGQEVVVSLPEREALAGHAQRIDVQGRLVVVDPLGVEHAVSAGDVEHVR